MSSISYLLRSIISHTFKSVKYTKLQNTPHFYLYSSKPQLHPLKKVLYSNNSEGGSYESIYLNCSIEKQHNKYLLITL